MRQTKLEESKILIEVSQRGNYLVPPGITLAAFCALIDPQLKHQVMAAICNHRLIDLHDKLEQPCVLELVLTDSDLGLRIYRRSVEFLLVKACHDVFPKHQMAIKYSISNALFCEFTDFDISIAEIKQIDERMMEIINDDLPINKVKVGKNEALLLFKRQEQIHKAQLMQMMHDQETVLYEIDGFYENSYTAMVNNTGILEKFRLLKYYSGFLMQNPETHTEGKIEDYIEQKNLANVFTEAKEWSQMLNISYATDLNRSINNGEIGDIIRVNEALHEKKIAYIADEICRRIGARVVLISGPSSSGKTTFAQRLMIQLRVNGKKPISISIDNYFVDRVLTPLNQYGEYDFEALEAIQISRLNQDLSRLIRGEKVQTPAYNFRTGKSEETGPTLEVAADDFIILEGIHALNDQLTPIISNDQKYKIFISALTPLNLDTTNRIPTTHCRLIRRIIRDVRTRGYNALETLKRWPFIRKSEDASIFPFQEEADICFNSSLVYELSILKDHAEPLLREIAPQNSEYIEACRLLDYLSFFYPALGDEIPNTSILREFIGDSSFRH